MKQIIVAYDGSESAKRALERGADVAKAFDAKVIVTSVASLLHSGPRADQQFELHSPPTSGPEIQRDSLADHEAQLADATAFFAERGIEAEPVAGSGDPPPRSCPSRNSVTLISWSSGLERRDSPSGSCVIA